MAQVVLRGIGSEENKNITCHVDVFLLLLPFAVGGGLVNLPSLCDGRKAARSSSPLRWPEDLLIFAPRAGQSSSALRWLEAGAGGSLFPNARLNLHPVFGGRRGAAQTKAQANATEYHVWVVWVLLGSICSQSDQTETQCS